MKPIKTEHGGPKHGKGPEKKATIKRLARKKRRAPTQEELDAFCDRIMLENPRIFARLAIND